MSESKPALSNPVVNYVLGPVLMFAGMWLSTTKPSFMSFEEVLAKQGVELDLGVTIAVIGVFLILFPVINFFFVKPLAEAIHHRTEELEKTFGEAESLRSQMSDLKADYEKRLAATEAEAREKIQAQVKEAQELKKSLTAEAQAKADDMKAAAAAEIEAERKKVLSDLRVHVATLSLQASEKIMKENMDTTRNRALIDDFLKTVEVKN